jgi:hypothetical protein
MTEDTSPENLRKFLESDDPAMVRMGLSMAKGTGVPEKLLPNILRLYMWDDDKTVRAAAKSVFNKHAPKDTKDKIKEVWKPPYRFLKEEFGSFRYGSEWGNFPNSHFTPCKNRRRVIQKWAKILDGFRNIILFYETFQSQKEIACTILDPIIYFLGQERWLESSSDPLRNPGFDLSYWDDPNAYRPFRQYTYRLKTPKTRQNIWENPTLISAIKTLRPFPDKRAAIFDPAPPWEAYNFTIGSRETPLFSEYWEPTKQKERAKILRENVAYILDTEGHYTASLTYVRRRTKK